MVLFYLDREIFLALCPIGVLPYYPSESLVALLRPDECLLVSIKRSAQQCARALITRLSL